MATYLVWSGGNNTSGTEASGWANAYQKLTSALGVATTAGDVIKVHKTHDDAIAVDTTYTVQNNISIICVDKDAGDAVAEMGIDGWVGSNGAFRVTVAGAFKVYFYGITFRVGSSANDPLIIGSSDGASYTLEKCYLWVSTVAAVDQIQIGQLSTNNTNGYFALHGCTFRFGNAAQNMVLHGRCELYSCVVSSAGAAPTILLKTSNDAASTYQLIEGCDLSHVTGTLVGDATANAYTVVFANCKLGTGVTVLASQTVNRKGSASAWVYNSSAGDLHYEFGHFDALGSTVAVTSPYISDGALYDGTNKVTWKIVTTDQAGFYFPYVTPWIETYHAGTTAITPSIEGLMIDDATVAHNNEVWAEFGYQGTTGFPLEVFVNDRMTPLGSSAAQTSSKTYSDWTASPATDTGDSTFKLAPESSFTPQEIGMLRARVCVGEASKTLYIDPKIRT